MPRLVIHFTHLRPYHLTRLRSAEEAFAHSGTSVHGLALIDSTGPLPPDLPISRPSTPPLILFPECSSLPASSRRISREVFRVLDQLRPTAIAICGYATPDARACLRWCRRHKAKAILMTETRECDGPRVWWKEWIKSRVVRSFHGALCGGPESRAYLEKLGMPADRIAEGYDVVDNEYFAQESDRIRAEEGDRVHPYFLGSNRFIPRKNVSALIEAYALYLKSYQLSVVSCPLSVELDVGAQHSSSSEQMRGTREVQSAAPANHGQPTTDNRQRTTDNRQPTTAPWHLCLLGDGDLKASLIAQCHRLGLTVQESAPWEESSFNIKNSKSNIVYFPGWRSHAELPRFYAHAGAFVHPAISEPWGLVVNEAMASGLPVLVSPGTGAASTLTGAGTTVASFNPASPEIAARHLEALTTTSDDENKHAAASGSRSRVQSRAALSAFGMELAGLL